MKKEKQKMGNYYENDDYRLEVKYSKKARDQELLKIKLKKGDTVEFKAADLLKIITENIKKKDLALALSETEVQMESIAMVKVVRNLRITLDHDVKTGEVIDLPYEHMYPYFLALAEEMYHIALTKGEVQAVPLKFAAEVEKMREANMNLAEKINKPTLDAIEKSKQVETK